MKKTKTWIITCIYLQLFFVCFGSPCTNPLTDAVHDIEKLVGNLPNDYIMRLKRVPAKDHLLCYLWRLGIQSKDRTNRGICSNMYVASLTSLAMYCWDRHAGKGTRGHMLEKLWNAKHCWLYVMVHELSSRLEVLVNRFANTSQNYKILGDLTLIFREIRNCVNLNEQMDFIEEYLDNISEGEFVPREFFNSVTSTFDVFKDINNTNYNTTCDLPTSDPELSYITNGNTQYASSHLRNSTRIVPGYTESIEMNSRLPLQWPSIASIALMSIVVGFAFGVLCWKVKHRRGHTETAIPGITVDQREANENMLQQTAREVSVI